MISPLSNIGFLIGQRGLGNAQQVIQQAMERLATGKQINRASDDPSGMIAVDEFTQRIKAIEKELEALDLEEARLGATEGALSVVSDMTLELQGIVVQAANRGATSPEERLALQEQVDSIIEGMDMLANTTVFRGEKLFEGLFSSRFGMMYAADNPDEPPNPERVTLAALKSGGLLNVVDGDLEAAQQLVDQAVDGIAAQRGAIGSRITNQIAPARNVLLAEMEQSESARSDIEDADIAVEMSNLIRGQILQQASISALLMTRQSPQNALKMLQPNLEIARNTTAR